MAYENEKTAVCARGGERKRPIAVARAILLMAMTMAIAAFGFRTNARAEIASGTSGTCSWVIDDGGTLTISPRNGVGGQLASVNGGNGPWYSYRGSIKKIIVNPGVKAGNSCYRLFYKLTACTEMDLSNLDTSSVTDMSIMFYGCSSLTNLNVSNFDTSSVTDMQEMFSGCSNLTSLDVGSWDTDSVTNMKNMFRGCSNITSLDVGSWDIGSVTNTESMFSGCSNLTSLDVGSWDTGSVTNMCYMFSGCSNLTNLNVSNFDTDSVSNMENMFDGCSNLTSLDVGSWDTGFVTNMKNMFNKCSNLTSLDVGSWNTESVTNMDYMFSDCSGLTSLNLNDFDTGSVTNMLCMFKGCSGLTNLDLSSFDTGSVTNMSSMFSDCSGLANLDLSGFDTRSVTSMNSMFQGCSSLASLDLSSWDTGSVTDMGIMFGGCTGLTSLNLNSFDTGSVNRMYNMFSGCSGLTSLDLSNFATGSVTDMSSMFVNCISLMDLNVSGWDTRSVTGMRAMFCDCCSLASLDLSSFDTGSVTDMTNMFAECESLANLDLSGFDTESVKYMQDMFNGCSSLASLDISGFDTGSVRFMDDMFLKCQKLAEIDIGENFSFSGNGSAYCALPNPPSATTTQKWIREDESFGPYTPNELSDNYTSAMAGKWVWQEKPIYYTVKFLPPDTTNYAGSMPDQKIVAAEDGVLDKCAFYRFNYHIDRWEDGDGNIYQDKQTISANTFHVGDVLTLTAVFVENENYISLTDGEIDLYLHGGEKATFSGIPGGTTYQIMEETPSGWQLVSQTGAAGAIPANGVAQASFTNEYVPGTATISLMARKTLDGRAPAGGAFAFVLEGEGERQEATNGDSGLVQFEPLTFRTPGTRTYTIREIRGDDPGISYDAHVVTVTVDVQDDGSGNLTATSSLGDEIPSFENETKPGTLTVTKHTDGQGTGEEIYSFEIVLSNESGMPLDGANVVIG